MTGASAGELLVIAPLSGVFRLTCDEPFGTCGATQVNTTEPPFPTPNILKYQTPKKKCSARATAARFCSQRLFFACFVLQGGHVG